MTQKNLISVSDFCKRNGIRHNQVYEEISAGRLTALKIGRRTLISVEAERQWIESLPRLRLREAAVA